MHLCLHCFDVASFTFSPHQVTVTEAKVTIANVEKQHKNIQGNCYVSIKHNYLFFVLNVAVDFCVEDHHQITITIFLK
jgi:hypothetical protein